jgi:hypothetical protein
MLGIAGLLWLGISDIESSEHFFILLFLITKNKAQLNLLVDKRNWFRYEAKKTSETQQRRKKSKNKCPHQKMQSTSRDEAAQQNIPLLADKCWVDKSHISWLNTLRSAWGVKCIPPILLTQPFYFFSTELSGNQGIAILLNIFLNVFESLSFYFFSSSSRFFFFFF